MITDTLANASNYHNLGARVAAGLEFLTTHDLASLEPGRYEIMGDECSATIDEYRTHLRETRRWEAHREHIDIQYIVTGTELMGCVDLATMQSVEYDPARDLEFLDGPDGELVPFEAGTFVILYPEDAHMPSVAICEPEPVRKVVVKVLVDG